MCQLFSFECIFTLICVIIYLTHMKTPFISVVYQQHLINAAILRLNGHLYMTRFRTGLLFIITFSFHEDESNVTNTQVNMVFLLWSNHRPQSIIFNSFSHTAYVSLGYFVFLHLHL